MSERGVDIRMRAVSDSTRIPMQIDMARLINAVSPRATVERVEGGVRVRFEDIDGAHEATVMDGVDGVGIAEAALNDDYTLTLYFTDGGTYTTPSIRGEPGEPGVLSVVDGKLCITYVEEAV